ncbi:MAG: ferrochelatase [Pseudomonadales bacterium]
MRKSNARLGILLVNLGTPDAPTAASIRRYLREFLSDPRVVNIPRLVWLPILYGFILPFRPKRLVENYAAIWMEEGAPIRHYTAKLAQKVEADLESEPLSRPVRVLSAMTYGNPSIRQTIASLREDGIDDLMVVPLFPQYSAATTAAVFDKLAAAVKHSSRLGDLRFVDDYFESSQYIHALTKSLEVQARHLDKGAKIIFSFHGIPKAQEKAGDPYPKKCFKTAELIAHSSGLNDDQWLTTFQSRFGPAPWLQPYTDKTLEALPAQGIRRVVVVCPGFATDCLETLEEIQVENRDIFMSAGGDEFTYIPALNDSDEHVQVISQLILSRLYRNESLSQ